MSGRTEGPRRQAFSEVGRMRGWLVDGMDAGGGEKVAAEANAKVGMEVGSE